MYQPKGGQFPPAGAGLLHSSCVGIFDRALKAGSYFCRWWKLKISYYFCAKALWVKILGQRKAMADIVLRINAQLIPVPKNSRQDWSYSLIWTRGDGHWSTKNLPNDANEMLMLAFENGFSCIWKIWSFFRAANEPSRSQSGSKLASTRACLSLFVKVNEQSSSLILKLGFNKRSELDQSLARLV